jgi:hypothetical protein
MIESGMTLEEFIHKAQLAGYAAGAKFEINPERPGFKELTYAEDDWFYRDSFTGWFKSRGMEIVRHHNLPIWASMYGGGMINPDKNLTHQTFDFLKRVLSVENKGFVSFRGPVYLQLGEWEYRYQQAGTVLEFEGEEQILRKKKLVFTQRVIGGEIKQLE